MPSQTPSPPPTAVETEQPPYPLYNASYTLHRLSPLHHSGSTAPFLSAAPLSQHAQRLTSILRGDVLRGVQVGFGPDDGDQGEGDGGGLGSAGKGKGTGALRGCEWTVLQEERRSRSGDREGVREGDMEVTGTGRKTRTRTGTRTRTKTATRSAAAAEEEEVDQTKAVGIHIIIRYEKNIYTALLLRSPPRAPPSEESAAEEDESTTSLPLLLTRMPGSLRSTLTSYLASTFDCHVSALRLSSGFLVAALEGWLEDLQGGHGNGVGDGDGSGSGDLDRDRRGLVKELVKEIHLTLSFAPPVAPALRTLEVVVQAADVEGFVRAGEGVLRQQGQQMDSNAPRSQTRKRKRKGGDVEDVEGEGESRGPFTAALARYLDAHLALRFGHSDVQVVKIACGAFVLGAEGRVRIVDQRRGGGGGDGKDGGEKGERAMRGLVARLVSRAMGREEG